MRNDHEEKTTIEDQTLRGDSDVPIAVTSYSPPDNPSMCVIISSGTGFSRHFYRRIATFWATQGAFVITY
ncbi:MAG: hypothetical protein AAFV29_17620, partial [Myxococcota bacterium]